MVIEPLVLLDSCWSLGVAAGVTKIIHCILQYCLFSREHGPRQIAGFLDRLFPEWPGGGTKMPWWIRRWGKALLVGGVILTCWSSLGWLQSTGTGRKGDRHKVALFSPYYYEKAFVSGVKRLPQGRSDCSVWDGQMPMPPPSPSWLMSFPPSYTLWIYRTLSSEAHRTQSPPGLYTPSCTGVLLDTLQTQSY